MLISALCDYHDILAKKNKLLPEGYSGVGVHYIVELTPEGRLAAITDHREKISVRAGKGKTKEKLVPRTAAMPKRTEKPGIDANVAEHRALYLFGLNYAEGEFTEEDRTDKAKKSHEAFVQKQLEFLEGLDSPLVNAFRNFALGWRPAEERNNALLLSIGNAYANSGYAFCLAGRPDMLLHEDPVIRAAWEERLSALAKAESGAELAQCSITGRQAPIPLIHDKIKGFPGGSSMGNALVSFNSPAVESYGKAQSANSAISQLAMQKYTKALNYLVQSVDHRTMLHSWVIVHWAMSENELYDKAANASLFEMPDGLMDANETDAMLKKLMEKLCDAAVSNEALDISEYLDPDVSYYMVGLKTNSARLAVEFIYRDRFGTIMQNVARHQADLCIAGVSGLVYLRNIERELINPHSSKKEADPALMSRTLEAIFHGYRYPAGLLSTVIRRVKSDSDAEDGSYLKLSALRAGIIKACLNRNKRAMGQKEEIGLALNNENHDPAYLCGRLFAVLEKLQQDASTTKLNRTIKDAYFASACTTPAAVFPRLIMLAQHHVPNAKYGGYWEYQCGQICGVMGDRFPQALTLDEQGAFILGYYQQYWAKNESKDAQSENDGEE